jgi:large repetitive protein
LIGNQSPYLVDVAPNRVVGTTTLTITVADPDGDALTIGLGTAPANGTFGALSPLDCVEQPDGSDLCTATVEFTPESSYFGYDAVEVTLDDGINPLVTNSRVIQFGNRAPIAKTDILMTDLDTAATVRVTANDDDPDGDALALGGSTDGAGGTAVCVDDGFGTVDCTYTPNAGFEGLDRFTYTLVDSYGGTSIGWVEVTVQPGGSGVTPTDCPTVASALDGGGIITGENWVECSSPTANGVSHQLTPLLEPVAGSALLLTSGDRDISPGPSYGGGSGRSNGTSVRGANDVSILAVDLDIPDGPTCLRFDVVFASDEYPEFVNSPYNDAFLAELDTNSWSVSGSVITAPDNFAFDPDGNVLSINSTFFDAGRVVAEPDNGMEYDGATRRLLVQTPITAGAHTVYFTIFDAGDGVLDTAALIDNLRAVVPGPEGCTRGANRPPVVTDSAVTIDEDTTASITVVAVDDDGDMLTAEIGPASHGTATLDGVILCTGGVCQIPISYVPNPNVNVDLVGEDSFVVTVSDGNGGIATGTVTVTITPVPDPPTAADMVVSTDEDTPLDFTLVGNDPDGTPVTFALTDLPLHGSVVCVESACTYTPDENYAGPDSFGYTVSSGGETVAGTVTIDVIEVNDAPVAVIVAGTSTLPEGTSIGLDATTSSDVDGTIVAYLWQVTSGGTITNPTSATPTLNGVDDAVVTVTLRVTDDDGATDVTTSDFTVTNVSPTVDAGADLGIQPGELATVTVGFSDPGILDTHTATVDWGEGAGAEAVGAVDTPTFDVSHTYAAEGTYTVEVCVTDDFPATTCDSVLVEVELVNVPPTVLSGGPYVLDEGEVGLLAGSVVDADGNLDPATILWTSDGGAQVGFGDATSATSTVTGFQDGVFTLTLAASDLLGASGSASTTLTVSNVAPTISSFVVTDGVPEGSTVGLNAVFSDPGTFDTHTATVDWAYPSTAVSVPVDNALDLVSTTHVYPQDGVYDVRLCISDDDDTTCQTIQITVANVAPTVDVTGGIVVNGSSFDLTATFSDPGADTFTATIDWENDGIDDEVIDPATSPITSSHTYPGPGVYTVEVCVSDGVATGCATATVEVTEFNQAPIAIDDFVDVPEGTGDRVIDVLGNDSDPESNALSIVSNTDPGTGTVTCSADDCTFNAPGGFVGSTTFDYTISDGDKQDTATVTIDVVACPDLTGAFAESNVTISGAEWVECASPAAHATAGADLTPLLVPDGSLALLTTGLASESYGTPGDSADENLGRQFRGAFDASVLRLDLDIPIGANCLAFDVVFASEEYPDFVDKPYNDGFLAELGASTWSVLGSTIIAPDNFAFDGDGDYISVKGSFFDPGRVVTDTGMSYNGSSAVLRVRTPISSGPNSLFLSIFDGADAAETSAALIERLEAFQSNQCNPGAGEPPIAVDDDYTVNEDSSTLLDVVANDFDPEGAAVTIFDVVTPPQHGTVIPTADRTAYTYIPFPNYYGPDSFEYSITDVPNASETEPVAAVSIATVTLQVDEVNDVPVARPDSAAATGSAVTIDVLDNDYDVDATDGISITSYTDPLFGTVTCATSCTYTPQPGYDGPDRFTYTIIDAVLPGSEDPALAPRGATSTTTVYINSTIPPDDNIPPIADAGGPYTADACAEEPCVPTALDGSGSFDPDGTFVTYSWFVAPSPPASLTGENTVSPDFLTSANGSFTVYLIVYDADGAWGWDATSVSAFAGFVGSADGSSSIDEGSSATATVDFFNPGGDLTTTIDWGDGSPVETIDFSIFPVVKTHLYPQDGTFLVEICVRGTTVDGPVDLCDTPTLVVDNVVPVVDAGVDRTLVVGGTLVQNRMSFVDPGADAPWTATVDWGDGSPVEALVVDDATGLITMPVGHVYPIAGVYTVTVCVVDDDAPGCDTFVVNVSENQPPVADAGGPYEVAEGGTLTLDASGSTDADGTIETWIWESADPLVTLTDADTETPDFSAADNGDFEVTLRVCDDRAACSDVVAVTVTVTNAVPQVDAGDDQTVAGGVAAVLEATFSDPGTADTHTATIDWGDGTVEPGTVVAADGAGTVGGSHTYAAPGVYTVQVCVTDDDLGQGCDTTLVSVSNEPPVAVDDFVVTDEDTPVTVAVLANDVDPDGDALTVTAVSTPANGTAVIDADGTIVYTPNANFNGIDELHLHDRRRVGWHGHGDGCGHGQRCQR